MPNPCMPCNGTGHNTCAGCGGAGATFLSKSRLGYSGRLEFYQERTPCRLCFGTGRTTCLSCGGIGWILPSDTSSPSPGRNLPRDQPRSAGSGRPESAVSLQVFAFEDYQFVYHPDHPDISAFWQHNPGNVLDVNWGTSSTMRIDVASCGRDAWLAVVTPNGQTLPLTIYVGNAGALLGRWL